MGQKEWYQSKAIWAGVVSVAVVVYNALVVAVAANFGYHLPQIPNAILGLLGMAGIYGRVTATTTINH